LLIPPQGMATLCGKCRGLTLLSVEGCSSLSDKTFIALGDYSTRLQTLSCKGVKVSPQVRHIWRASAPPSTLSESVSMTNWTAMQGVQYLLHRVVGLELLNLSHCPLLSGEFIALTLRHRCPKLFIDVEDSKKRANFTLQ